MTLCDVCRCYEWTILHPKDWSVDTNKTYFTAHLHKDDFGECGPGKERKCWGMWDLLLKTVRNAGKFHFEKCDYRTITTSYLSSGFKLISSSSARKAELFNVQISCWTAMKEMTNTGSSVLRKMLVIRKSAAADSFTFFSQDSGP